MGNLVFNTDLDLEEVIKMKIYTLKSTQRLAISREKAWQFFSDPNRIKPFKALPLK